MEKQILPDWSLWQTFVAVAETGSLSAAARHLGQTQPTVGRQVRALEARLDIALFRRLPRGLSLTEAGERLLPHALAMQAGARNLALSAAGEDAALSGTVRITASEIVSYALLPPILSALRRTEPQIMLELVPSDTSENLLYREADIALRMYRPTQLDVITRHVGDVPMGLYATPDYLARHGAPKGLEEIGKHYFIGYDRSTLIVDGMRALGLAVSRDSFPVRCDNQIVYWQLVCSGAGIGITQARMGDAEPRVQRILPDLPLPTLPVWLTATEALHRSPRIRRVFDFLAAEVRQTLRQK